MIRASTIIAILHLLAVPVVAQTDLAPLFAPPTAAELVAVDADWSLRNVTPTNWSVVDQDVSGGFTVQVVSHDLGGSARYGAVRLPRVGPPGGPWPVVLLHHGGTSGFDLDFLLDFDVDHLGACLADSFLVVAPTYRDETFRGQGVVSTRTSAGDPSPFDRDADDAIALLTAVLDAMPEADDSRIVQWGRSRGANVAWHVALRDPRVRRTTAYFAPTDFRTAAVQADCQQAVDTGVPSTDSLAKRVMSFIVEPWIAGTTSLAEARHQLTAWSVTPHLDEPLAVQIHHGEADDRVPVQHAHNAASALTAAGAVAPGFALFTYPGGGHDTSGLSGHAALTEPYLCLPAIPVSVDPPTAPVAPLLVSPNPFRGHLEISRPFDHEKSIFITICDIMDASGRLVRTLPLPSEQTIWDGRDTAGRRCPSGVYLLRLRGESGPAARVIMVK